jgi:hypothetical protein
MAPVYCPGTVLPLLLKAHRYKVLEEYYLVHPLIHQFEHTSLRCF